MFLVGAGPGDPELLTLKAFRLLQTADAVLYDALVGEEILKLIPKGVEKIYVGKRRGNHFKTQEEINLLLLKLARSGRRIVRLKGGDPFIFGRGGEELLFLASEGVDVEVVPGVSSFYAAPQLFGIPLTYRGVASSFTVVTGHRTDNIDWKALAASDTLVFLMAVSNRVEIAEKLLEAGRPWDEPVAFISNAYRKGGRLVKTSLGNLVSSPPEVESPAVMVVGKVINLANRLPQRGG